jgi:hypothetical protein
MTDDEMEAMMAGAPKGKPPASMTDEEMEKAMAQPAPKPEEPSLLKKYVLQPFQNIGRGLLSADQYLGNAIVHPVDTAQTIAKNPTAAWHEAARGINSNIPFASTLVEKAGGIPAESAEDAAAVPGLQNFASVASSLPVGSMVGGLAAKGVEAAAPAASRLVNAIGESAQGRQVDRAMEGLELKANKTSRLAVRTPQVEAAIAENPELRAAVGNDEKLGSAAADMKARAIEEIDRHYAGYKVTLGDTIDGFNSRIKELRTTGTSTDAAVADKLEGMRDELTARLGQRGVKSPITVKHLRAEQSDFQGQAYRRSLTADDSIKALAADEAQRAVGDAVIKRVTGLPNYAAAKAVAAADSNSISARLLKANDQVTAANRIEATIEDRASRVQPPSGLPGKLRSFGKAIGHPVGYVLGLGPRVAASGLESADNLVARLANPALPQAGNAVAQAAGRAPAMAMGQLYQLVQSGLRGPELSAAAQAAGMPQDRADAFAQLASESDARRGQQ